MIFNTVIIISQPISEPQIKSTVSTVQHLSKPIPIIPMETYRIDTNDNFNRVQSTLILDKLKPSSELPPPTKPPNEYEIINTYIHDVCSKYNNISPALVNSIIEQESGFNPMAKNGDCLGLMQVSSYWHKDRAEELGVTDFYDPYSNILLGVDYLSELSDKYNDIRLVLMLYSMKHNSALKMYANGEISTYAKIVIARSENYTKRE
jgi:soluble lytic murein transglycosylase-like protein